jgi:hypothetical protein
MVHDKTYWITGRPRVVAPANKTSYIPVRLEDGVCKSKYFELDTTKMFLRVWGHKAEPRARIDIEHGHFTATA